MKILADENTPRMTINALRVAGHDVLDVRSTANKGAEDATLWTIAQRERRLVITTDKDFAQYRNEKHYGILIVRLRQPNRHKIHPRIMQVVAQYSEEEWAGLLVTMRDTVQTIWRAGQNK